jgi:hypothetical protein
MQQDDCRFFGRAEYLDVRIATVGKMNEARIAISVLLDQLSSRQIRAQKAYEAGCYQRGHERQGYDRAFQNPETIKGGPERIAGRSP